MGSDVVRKAGAGETSATVDLVGSSGKEKVGLLYQLRYFGIRLSLTVFSGQIGHNLILIQSGYRKWSSQGGHLL